jgi:hypothetical protein
MSDLLLRFYLVIDAGLIFCYRLTETPILNFMIGTFCLGMLCVILGELSVSLALKFNKPYIDEMAAEMHEKERLSVEAYQAGNTAGYKALNKAATDAWGKRFFTMTAHSAGILWPLPLALGWMQTRFGDVDFALAYPLSLLFGESVGYTFTFIPMYILCRIVFKYMRPWLPYFRGVQKMLDAGDASNPASPAPKTNLPQRPV